MMTIEELAEIEVKYLPMVRTGDNFVSDIDVLIAEVKRQRAEIAQAVFDAIRSDVQLWYECAQGDDPVGMNDIVCISVNSCLKVLFDKLGYGYQIVDGKDTLVEQTAGDKD